MSFLKKIRRGAAKIGDIHWVSVLLVRQMATHYDLQTLLSGKSGGINYNTQSKIPGNNVIMDWTVSPQIHKVKHLKVGPLGGVKYKRGYKIGDFAMELVLLSQETPESLLSLLCEDMEKRRLTQVRKRVLTRIWSYYSLIWTSKLWENKVILLKPLSL